MPDSEREIMGREAVRLLNEQIISAKELITKVEERLGKEESTRPEEWEELKADLDRNIMALSGLEEMGMLIAEQKGLLTKLKAQQEQLDRLAEERKRAMPEAA
ncbi:hypothetical protein KKD80_01900 [Patescibacteria group bacterium]|nr:hypothetical protein [Patescibacteria group bacterium]